MIAQDEYDWIYYRIYAQPKVENWYSLLLREVVNSFISKNEKLIESFFFFMYHHQYGVAPYDGKEAEEPQFEKGDEVWFIRLRVLVHKENLQELEEDLLTFIEKSKIAITKEKCKYDELADLGDRFGKERVKEVRNYLNSICILSLSLLEDERDAEYNEKIAGLIHLASNVLEYSTNVPCPRCGLTLILQP